MEVFKKSLLMFLISILSHLAFIEMAYCQNCRDNFKGNGGDRLSIPFGREAGSGMGGPLPGKYLFKLSNISEAGRSLGFSDGRKVLIAIYSPYGPNGNLDILLLFSESSEKDRLSKEQYSMINVAPRNSISFLINDHQVIGSFSMTGFTLYEKVPSTSLVQLAEFRVIEPNKTP